MSLRAHTIRLAAMQPVDSVLRHALLSIVATENKVALRLRDMGKFLAMGNEFAILTPYLSRPKSENKEGFGDFFADIQAMGYRRFEKLHGAWEGLTERSVLIPGMSFQDAFDLGVKYRQASIIYKDPSGAIGMYYMTGDRAQVAVRPDGDMAVELSQDPQHPLISRSRTISFEFGIIMEEDFPWHRGMGPITRDEVIDWIDPMMGHS